MTFGRKTEKRRPRRTEEKKEGTVAEGEGEAATESETKETLVNERKRAIKGHGRKPASAYSGAKVVICRHPEHEARVRCPNPFCSGHLYQLTTPNIFIQFTGRPLIKE